MESISIQELEEKIESRIDLIDIREEDEYVAGHVPGAINIPMSKLETRLNRIPENAYLICQLGGRSARAQEFLATQGINTINVLGGTEAWEKDLEI
ncbi:rhodanese-like domain-containing protein [Lactovum miscens]|uniref:Rhodanese-related sulfurtransferase n=1 Tax=Lactovum miscens TaxID=190387 RepID=A0A841C5Z9_9LACT|nr:rhodanese-like domain-containing protein [Lactovum miscens]MBB5887697.1 rhodanese-related sulfurtransferase [Lactovum miscens]